MYVYLGKRMLCASARSSHVQCLNWTAGQSAVPDTSLLSTKVGLHPSGPAAQCASNSHCYAKQLHALLRKHA